ncbi:uncharacterized protein LOC119769070 [Culex quinquefasciatus]|uniref:uncharacterized protein LOC119769070 n=1 Tax=Culex quinquefasciatus TaxID=7176 RepID=UPI0018E3289A|nr:uncharacterized protein LOC119769070 [Culex quinquefasciatus]
MREEPEISLQSAARLPIFPTTQQKEIQPARPCHVVRSNSRLHTPSLDRVSPADISSSPSRINQRSETVIYVRGTRPDRTARYAAKPERNYRLASRPASVPKVSGSPHQARDAKVDGETPPAAFEARRAHGGRPAPCRRTSPI